MEKKEPLSFDSYIPNFPGNGGANEGTKGEKTGKRYIQHLKSSVAHFNHILLIPMLSINL